MGKNHKSKFKGQGKQSAMADTSTHQLPLSKKAARKLKRQQTFTAANVSPAHGSSSSSSMVTPTRSNPHSSQPPHSTPLSSKPPRSTPPSSQPLSDYYNDSIDDENDKDTEDDKEYSDSGDSPYTPSDEDEDPNQGDGYDDYDDSAGGNDGFDGEGEDEDEDEDDDEFPNHKQHFESSVFRSFWEEVGLLSYLERLKTTSIKGDPLKVAKQKVTTATNRLFKLTNLTMSLVSSNSTLINYCLFFNY
jgi:hypothetical protein